jgi:hypothetical protein
MKTGDAVTIEWTENGYTRKVDGSITLASPNGRSLMLEFEAIMFGAVGMQPVLKDDDGVYRSVLTNEPVIVREK